MSLSRVLVSTKAAVASEHPLASLAGYEVLKSGGNAFDAAVAVAFVLSVVQHPAGGLGGDFFAQFLEAETGRVHCLNSSGWAPSGMTTEFLKKKGRSRIPLFGPFSVVIPGFVGGVYSMHKRFGSLEFGKLLSPSIEYALNGFPATEGFCRSTLANYDKLPASARKIFAPSGQPPVVGELIIQKNLARVIQEVAEGGSDAFYKNWPASEMLKLLNEEGIGSEMSDFDFEPEWVEPLIFEYGDGTVYEIPPNSMGATSLLTLKLLRSSRISVDRPDSKERIVATVRAAKVAYEKRDRMLGDPRFSRIDMEDFMGVDQKSESGGSRLKPGDTTAFSVVDKNGNLVSAIQSLYHHYGSKVFLEKCGIILNNRAAGFSMSGPNVIHPRKRPLHTLSSLLVAVSGKEPTIALGCSGGDYRPIQHALFVSNIIDYKMSLEQSIDFPRFLWDGGRRVIVEEGYRDTNSLVLDVELISYPGRTGVAQGVELMNGRARKAVCDVRGDGLPSGL